MHLPIDPLIPEIVNHLRAAENLVLEAPPGAGKTTRVPSALLDLSEREVLVKFLRGGALPSAGELPPGEGEARSISLTSLSEIKENVLRKLVREAVMLNMSLPAAVLA